MKNFLRISAFVLCVLIFPVAQARVLPENQMKAFAQSRRTLRQNVREAAAMKTRKRMAALVPLPNLFENADLGIRIRYPQGWAREDLLQQEDDLTLVVMFLSPFGSRVRENVNLVLESLAGREMTLDEYTVLGLAKEEEFFQNFKLVSNERSSVAGQVAQRVTFSATTQELSMTFRQVWFFHRGQVHVWTFADESAGFAAHVPVFEAMLESLVVR